MGRLRINSTWNNSLRVTQECICVFGRGKNLVELWPDLIRGKVATVIDFLKSIVPLWSQAMSSMFCYFNEFTVHQTVSDSDKF